MYKRRRRRRQMEQPSTDEHKEGTMCAKLLSTPIVLTKRLEEMDLFQGNNETFMKKVSKIQNSKGDFVKNIVIRIQNESKLNINNIEEKNFSNKIVNNIKQYQSLQHKIDIINNYTLAKQKFKDKIFKFSVLYKNTVEYYCLSNTSTIKAYVSVKSTSMNINKNIYEECQFVETLCCWLKRNHVVDNLKKSCEIDELVGNFMKQFHLCNPVCHCCVDCIRSSKDKLLEFPDNNNTNNECDDLPLISLKPSKDGHRINLNRKYSMLLDSKPNLENIICRTSYPDIHLLNNTHDEKRVVGKAVRLKELLKRRTILTNACNVILHKADNVIKMSESKNDLNNIIIELHYADKNNYEMTEIIELGDKGKIAMHVRKSGHNDTKNLGCFIKTHNKKIIKIRLCCVAEKNKALLRFQDKNMSPFSFLYLDTLYNHYIKKRQYYDNLCNWSSKKHSIHLNNDIQLGATSIEGAAMLKKNVSIDLCLENNNDNDTSLDNINSTLPNPVINSQNPSLSSSNQVSQASIVKNADKNIQIARPIKISSDMITKRKLPIIAVKDSVKPPAVQSDSIMSSQPKDIGSFSMQNIVTNTIKSAELSDSIMSSQPKDIGSFSMQNIITNTIKSKFNDPVKDNLIREINILNDYLRPKYLELKTYLDLKSGRVTTTVKTHNKISNDEINILQMIIFKTQKLVDSNLITSNEELDHVLSSLSISEDSENVDQNEDNLPIVITKTFTLKQHEIDAVYPEQRTVQPVTTNYSEKSLKNEDLTFHQYNFDDKKPIVSKTPAINNDTKVSTQSDINVVNVQSTTIPAAAIINNQTKNDISENITFHQNNLDGTNSISKQSITLPLINNHTATNITENSHTLLQCESNNKKPTHNANLVLSKAVKITKPPVSKKQIKSNKKFQNQKSNITEATIPNAEISCSMQCRISQQSNIDDKNLKHTILPPNNIKRIDINTTHTQTMVSSDVQPSLISRSINSFGKKSTDIPPKNKNNKSNLFTLTNNANTTLEQATMQGMPQLVPIIKNKNPNYSAVLYPINYTASTQSPNPITSGITTQNLMFVPMTDVMAAQNSSGNNQFFTTNASDSKMRVVVPESYSVPIPTPSSAVTVPISVLKPGYSVPQVQAQPYLVIRPILESPISHVLLNNESQSPENNVSYKTDIRPDFDKALHPLTHIESMTNDKAEMAEAITMWSKAPKSKKIVKTEIKTVMPLSTVTKRKLDLGNDEILDFFGEVKKIKISKTNS